MIKLAGWIKHCPLSLSVPYLWLQWEIIVGSCQALDLPGNQTSHIHHEPCGGGSHGVRLGVQCTQHPHSVAIGQHNGRANVAADVRRLGNDVEVPEPVKAHNACQPHIVSKVCEWCGEYLDGRLSERILVKPPELQMAHSVA